MSENVVEALRQSVSRVGSRPALILNAREQMSFAELWERSGRVASGLERLGLGPGGRAIVMIPMSLELYTVLVGILRLGAVAVFVDPWVGMRQIAAFAAFARPKAFLGIPKSHVLRLFEGRLRRLPITVTTGRRLGPWPARRTLEEVLRAGSGGEFPTHPTRPGDPALITFTSGSSGLPKGAERGHGFLLAQHRALAAEFPSRDDDVDMPMFPVFALNNLALGVTTVVPRMDFRRVDETDGGVIAGQIAEQGVTTLTASPPFLDRLVVYLTTARGPAPVLRRILTGGAPVSDAQLERWRRALPETEIVVVYGSTEAEPVAHVEAGERLALSKTGNPGYCVGRPTPRLDTHLVRITQGPIELGEGGWAAWEPPLSRWGPIGELVVAGEHVGQRYYQDPEATRANKIVDGSGRIWHRMGDTGYFDAEGRFWLVGRVHSTIQRGGEEVHPQLVEQAARGEDPRIRRLAAIGLTDAALGERVVVVVEAEPDDEPVLGAEVAERLRAAAQSFDEIRVVRRALPLDPRHRSKIDYPRLRRRLEKGRR